MLRTFKQHKKEEKDLKTLLRKYRIFPKPQKDQFFLNDKDVITDLVDLSNLNKKDTVLEIGAGTGYITSKIAEKAGEVIAFEIDRQFKPFLDKLPKNVEVYYEDIRDFIKPHGKLKNKSYNKIVSNLPYSFAEQFLHYLIFSDFEKAILIVPLKFVNTISNNGIFGSFFKPEIKIIIDREKFFPVPGTNSAVIDLIKLPDPTKTKNPTLFLRQYVYKHQGQLIKNSLVEGIINYSMEVYSKKVTKNQARKIIIDSQIETNLIEKVPVGLEVYHQISQSFTNLDKAILLLEN